MQRIQVTHITSQRPFTSNVETVLEGTEVSLDGLITAVNEAEKDATAYSIALSDEATGKTCHITVHPSLLPTR